MIWESFLRILRPGRASWFGSRRQFFRYFLRSFARPWSSRLLAQPPWEDLQVEKLNFQAVIKRAVVRALPVDLGPLDLVCGEAALAANLITA